VSPRAVGTICQFDTTRLYPHSKDDSLLIDPARPA